MALYKAGATGGTAGSPTPPQKPPLGTITVSTSGTLSHAHDLVIIELRLLGRATSMVISLKQRGGESINDRPFDLHFDPKWIDYVTGINCRNDTMNPHATTVDRDLDHLVAAAAACFIQGNAAEYAR